MATITLTADTDYSALTVANDDTIDCAGFILTLDVAPTETGVQVTSPGTNGRVVFDGGWNLSTWDFFAGESTSAGMIGTLPEGATIKSMMAGTITNARGIGTNNGTVTISNGGSGSGAHGISVNSGTVTTANGGSATGAHGISANNGTVTISNGGSGSGAHGIGTNNGTVTTSDGGSGGSAHGISNNNGTVEIANGGIGTNARGVNINSGTVTTATGGTHVTAYGIFVNAGLCLRLTDNTAKAVNFWSGDTCFVEGPHIDGVIPDNIKTIYSLGTLSASATIAADADVIEVSKGKGLTGIR